MGRIVAEGLGKQLGQTVIVGTHAINAALFRKLPCDTLRDFAPVAFIGYTPTLLVVAANSPVKTLTDPATLMEQVEQRAMRAEEMLPFNQAELAKWAELVKRSGAQVD